MKMNTNLEIPSCIVKDIPPYGSFVKIEPIQKGMSGDDKYCVEMADGQRFLLRISGIETCERKKTMFDMMGCVASRGVSMSRPVEFGVCSDGKRVYQLLSWCDGVTADDLLPALSDNARYMLGVKAGKNLKTIHGISAPEGIEAWYDRFTGTNDKRLRSFLSCGVPVKGSSAILNYYEKNRHLLRERPQCFIHGDYHNENLLVSPNHDIAVVDWDLLDSLYGDPWSEFNRISMSTNFFPHFASGLLHGYFGGEPPEAFWRVLALYLSTGALTLISWAVYVEPECLEECKQNAESIMGWFNGMESPVPTWYIPPMDGKQ